MKKLPLGIQHFDQLVERGCIYVDKTQQLHQLLSESQAVFLSRPRRFGKSLLLSTIAQLYSGKREFFKGLWIEDHWDWTKTHPVVHFYMDRTGFKDWGLRTGLNKHLDLIAVEHEVELKEESPAFRLSELVEKLYHKYQRRVVVLFDEYDKPMLDVLHLPEEAEKNRQILGDFYGILKPIGDKIEFLMLTGISKFSQVSVFSKLNHLEDITFHRRFSTLTGYTQEEVENNFAEYLQEVGQYQELSHEDLLKQIKYWYNGYTWDLKHYVYNPVSLMKFCSQGVFINHWFATGTPEFLIQELKKQHIYAPESAEINQLMFESYTLENLDPILLLFQTGYLTLRERLPNGFMRLDYPNHDVRSAFMEHLMAGYGHVSKLTPGPTVWKLREAFFQNNLELAISIVNTLFENIPSTLDRKNNEADYHAMLYLVFRYMGMDAEAEVAGLRGRSDAVLKTPTHVYVLEFKLDQSAEQALDYLRQKGYAEKYRHDGRPVLLLGINFSRAERCVEDWKVEGL